MHEVIKIDNVSKVYKIKNRHGNRIITQDFWALRDLTLSIDHGEVLGVIGKNGAGKSTLLKILSKITSPTGGTVTMNGRVGSLLEVGTGFHPEMTGRENIYMNGNILGMSNAEITRKLEGIIEFSGVADFLETPVKRYSSGMQTRLAFAVAAHLEPEILIIDEVLAVGDAEFQKRCLSKMEEIGSSGRTILFVSHNLDAIRNLCNRCIWLQEGRLMMDSKGCDEVIQAYLRETVPNELFKYSWYSDKNLPSEIESPVEILEFFLADKNNLVIERPVLSDEELQLTIKFKCKTELINLSVGYYLFSEQNSLIYMSLSTDSNAMNRHNYSAGEHTLTCLIPSNILGNGEYILKLAVGIDGQGAYYSPENSDIGILMMVEGNHMRSSLWRRHRVLPIYPIIQWSREG